MSERLDWGRGVTKVGAMALTATEACYSGTGLLCDELVACLGCICI